MRLIGILLIVASTVATSVVAQDRPAAQDTDADMKIPAGARIYIAPIEGGFDIYLTAAIHKKAVPLVVVSDRSKADFEMSGVTESERAGWAKMMFMRSTATAEQASIKIVNIKSGTVVYGYNVNKGSSARGKQSSSEACAKHLKEKIESGL
mgnify:CR=1 FL=1